MRWLFVQVSAVLIALVVAWLIFIGPISRSDPSADTVVTEGRGRAPNSLKRDLVDWEKWIKDNLSDQNTEEVGQTAETETDRNIPIAIDAYVNRDYLKAIRYFTLALNSGEISPDDHTKLIFILRNRGFSYYDLGLFELAIKDFSQVIRLDPNARNMYEHRSYAYKKTGQIELAIPDADNVIRLNPEDPINFWGRGDLFAIIGQYEQAIEDYDQAIRLAPNDPIAFERKGSALYNRGISYAKTKQFDLAIHDYNEVIRIDPFSYGTNDQFYFNRGYAYFEAGQFDSAVQDYSEAIRLDPTDAGNYYNRGISYSKISQFSLAIRDYTEAIRLNPTSIGRKFDTYFNRGHAYYEEGQYDLAIQDYSKAIRLDPDNPDAYNERSVIYRRIGEYELAIKDNDEIIQLDPENDMAYFGRGAVYSALDQKDLAIENYDKAIQLNPNFAAAYLNRGGVYFDKGQFDRAIQDETEAIRLKPNDPNGYDNRGLGYHAMGQYDLAIEDFTDAIRLDQDNAKPYVDRAGSYYERNQFGLAIVDYSKAIRLDPNNANAYMNRGLGYQATGQYDRTVRDLEAAVSLQPDFAERVNELKSLDPKLAQAYDNWTDPETIARIQSGLETLGYDLGPPDGVLEATTQTAIREFQEKAELPVTGKATPELALAIQAVIIAMASAEEAEETREPGLAATGTGVILSADGHVLTNNQVIENCKEVRISPNIKANIVMRDRQNDLALLASNIRSEGSAVFRVGDNIRLGKETVIAGYSLAGSVSSDLNVTTGTISALSGPENDARYLQITNPIQPGNSGGPLLDQSGNLIGIVTTKLDSLVMAEEAEIIPENVGFAIRASVAQAFLDANSVSYRTAESVDKLSVADIAAKARQFTVRVECWR